MKQTKWQRLATIGLCSSLVINAFSGATAVAETITIESSPTVASSAKEATSASSATPESTESSQETTETIREEVTQETEKPEAPAIAPAIEDNREVELQNYNAIMPKALTTVTTPARKYTVYFVDEGGKFINPATIDMSANNRVVYIASAQNPSPPTIQSIPISNGINEKTFSMVAANYRYDTVASYPHTLRGISDIRITIPKMYGNISPVPSQNYTGVNYPKPTVKTISLLNGTVIRQSVSEVYFDMAPDETINVYRSNYTMSHGPVGSFSPGYYYANITGSTNGNTISSTTEPIYYYLTNRRVTESFKDTAGATIPAPTGFTQGKQTSITSNNYTFKQAGTLPETYKASNGKTYKFKGWYKGKTKPNTLTTTKAPSYAVTYNNDDDLTVVYEEIEAFDFPALTYQFGFVDESGKRVDASTIGLTYDKWRGELLTNNVNDWKTVSLEKGQVAPTKNNLKEIAYPAQSLEIMSGRSSQYSAANLTFTPPRYYEKMSVYNKSGTFDAGYPFPNIQNNNSSEPSVEGLNKNLSSWFELKKRGNQSFVFNKPIPAAPIDVQVPAYLREIVYNPDLISNTAVYYVIDKPVYYYLTNRKVTENFVDTSGAKITAPTGFTQGKQTVINSDPYTFKQSGTLPDTYQAGGKTYKFKGWYKGKTKPNTLTTTKAPSYAVTYDDNDDLNVVYEEIEAFDFPAVNYQFGFVGEDGKLANPADINITYDYTGIEVRGNGGADSNVSFKTIASNQSGTTVGNFKQVIFPASSIERPTTTGWNGDGFSEFSIKLPKYYESVNLYDKTGKINTNYPLPRVTLVESNVPDTIFSESTLISDLALTQKADKSYTLREVNVSMNPNIKYPNLISRNINSLDERDGNIRYKTIEGPIYYHLTNRKVTENFVDTNGTKITPPTGFTQGNQIPMTSNTFKYTSAKALPASYTTGGKTYIFQGWYKGKTKPNTLTTSTTPTYNTTFDGNDDMTAMYKEEVPKASVALTRLTAETVTSGGNVTWRATITNTSQAPLTTATIKKSTAWTTGLAAPTAMIVTPAGGTAKTVPVTATTWTNGVSLGTDIPVGKSATVQFTTKATGTAGQVLRAGITTSGNYSGVSTSATVRVKDNDQAIVTPTAEGFISVPTFNFGQVGVAGSTQQHSLKKAADYYGNGTRNPYLRIKKTQPNWSLTAQLSQPKSATDSLPTATRLLLGAAPVSSFSNYNQPTELKNAVGTTSAISLNANNTATRIIANQQFTGSNIYQLDFTFNNVKLEVPANQGVKGQQYQAAITWNLVTGP